MGEEYTKLSKIDVTIDGNETIQSESTLHNIIQYTMSRIRLIMHNDHE